MLDIIFIFSLFFLACLYIYFKIVKKKGCSGCSSSKTGCGAQASCSSMVSPKTTPNEIQAKNLQK